MSVLEASLRDEIPHAHVCGGHGRCSTCRIRILGDLSALPPASAAEQAALNRVGVDVGVRLACQLRPTGDIAFVPMLPPNTTIVDLNRSRSVRAGDERYLAIMFIDLRGSSKLAEGRRPFDTVFVICLVTNRVPDELARCLSAATKVSNLGGETNSRIDSFGKPVNPHFQGGPRVPDQTSEGVPSRSIWPDQSPWSHFAPSFIHACCPQFREQTLSDS